MSTDAMIQALWGTVDVNGMFTILSHVGDRSIERCRKYVALAHALANTVPENRIANEAAGRGDEAAKEADKAYGIVIAKARESEDLEARAEGAQGIQAARLKAEIALAYAEGELAAVAIEEAAVRALAHLQEAAQAANIEVSESEIRRMLIDVVPDPFDEEPVEMAEAAA